MATLREAIEYSRNNPQDPKSKELYNMIKGGQMDQRAVQEGVDLSGAGRMMTAPQIAIGQHPAIRGFQPSQKKGETWGEIAKETGRDIQETIAGFYRETGKAGEAIVKEFGEKKPLAERVVGAGAEFYKGIGLGVEEIVIGAGKTLVSEETEKAVGEKIRAIGESVGETEIAQDLMLKYKELDPATKEQVDNILGYTEGLAEIGTAGLASKVSKQIFKGVEKTIEVGFKALPEGKVLKEGIEAVGEAVTKVQRYPSEVIGKTKNYLSRKNVKENFGSSIDRIAISAKEVDKPNPLFLYDKTLKSKPTKNPLSLYDEFYKQEQAFKTDIKQDTAIGLVGERIGGAYDNVITARRAVGKTMEKELAKIGDIKTNVSTGFSNFEEELLKNGVRFDSKTSKLLVDKTSKVAGTDKKLLETYIKELNKLNAEPSVAELDAFLSRVPQEIDIYKSKNNIVKVTNGERIIKQNLRQLREQISPKVNPLFENYYKARTDYSELSNFLDEGASFLGKKTQTGDFAKDASLAKSSVQSILNQGKKDWLLSLEDLTGYHALDESMLALQAMKDAGNFRGQSLLDLMTQETAKIPTTVGQVVEKGKEVVGKKFVGEPYEQTRRVIMERMGQKIETIPTQFKAGMSIQSVMDVKSRTPDFANAVDYAVRQLDSLTSQTVLKKGQLDLDLVEKIENVLEVLKSGKASLIEEKEALKQASEIIKELNIPTKIQVKSVK